MQAIAPVDVHVERDWQKPITYTKASQNTRPTGVLRMRTRVLNKPKPKKGKTPNPSVPKKVVIPKLNVTNRSRSSSPERGPWVPAPGRATKGQKVSWQSPESRIESIHLNTETPRSNFMSPSHVYPSPAPSLSTARDEKIMKEIQNYEKRIQGLINGVGLLKEHASSGADPSELTQLRSEIDSSLLELEQINKEKFQHMNRSFPYSSTRSRSISPRTQPRSARALSDDERQRRSNTRVSFQDESVTEKRRARSTTPIRTCLKLNPDREQLLLSLADSEADLTQITKQMSSVKDTLTKMKFDGQTVSFEIEQLQRQRNELLYLIEQYEQSNRNLRDFFRTHYHLEAQRAHESYQYDQIMIHVRELETENREIRKVLLDRENQNVGLQNELERYRTQSVGFDTMKHSLEQNRAHLQRELYSKEGEIHRLRSALRALEQGLHRPRSTHTNKHSNLLSSNDHSIEKTMVERLKVQLEDRDRQIHELEKKLNEPDNLKNVDHTNEQIVHLQKKLNDTERLANEYKAQLHSEALKSSANSSRNHLSQIDFEEKRARLQKRLEELEPLPELLKQAEQKHERSQRTIRELEKRLENASAMSNEKSNSVDSRLSGDDQIRALQRKIATLEEENRRLRQNSVMRNGDKMSQPSGRSTESSLGDHRMSTLSPSNYLEESSKPHFEYSQLKREKSELEKRLTAQINELKDKLDQSNKNNHLLQTHLNMIKTSYSALFQSSFSDDI